MPLGLSTDTELNWHRSLALAIRDGGTLLQRLGLSGELSPEQRAAAEQFPVLVPESFLRRMRPGDLADPLLRQVLPLTEEMHSPPDFLPDAVGDGAARVAPGLLHKYAGRALLIATGSCAVHCRYCFRRHYPYGEEPHRLDQWEPALEYIRGNASLAEILLSGGDPLMLTDHRLRLLAEQLDAIPHLQRLRIHTRLPIVLPNRITPELIEHWQSLRLKVIVVVHANHPAELVDDCAVALRRLASAGLMVLNQAVLLRGVNATADIQQELSERLIQLGVLPYYLHQLDRVAGAAHFEVPAATGREIIQELRRRLPGYAVPQYVQEIPGELHKTPLE